MSNRIFREGLIKVIGCTYNEYSSYIPPFREMYLNLNNVVAVKAFTDRSINIFCNGQNLIIQGTIEAFVIQNGHFFGYIEND